MHSTNLLAFGFISLIDVRDTIHICMLVMFTSPPSQFVMVVRRCADGAALHSLTHWSFGSLIRPLGALASDSPKSPLAGPSEGGSL